MTRSLLHLERLIARLRKMLVERRNTNGQIYVQHRVTEYRAMWKAVAQELGGTFKELSDDVWEIGNEDATTRIVNDTLEFDNPVTLDIAGMKPLLYCLLADRGLKVPEYTVFHLNELTTAYHFLSGHPQGCVIKPANGTSSGKGVTTHILTKREIRKAAILASLYSPELLIEPMVPGECYRLLVLKGKMIHAVCRRGPKLYGDGTSSVAKLINAENVRRGNQKRDLLDIDRDCTFTLHYQNLSLDHIPENHRPILIKSVNDPNKKQIEVRTIYTDPVTDLIGESIRADAESAARVLRADFVGVDFITTDPTLPLNVSGGIINEVNTTPGLHHHYNARIETFPQPALEAVASLLSEQVARQRRF